MDGPAANWVTAVPVGESSGPVHRVALAITGGERDHIVRHDPARVLRDVEAQRALLELHHAELIEVVNADHEERSGDWCAECDGETFPCRTLRLLASAYADHPDYNEAWRP